MQNPQQTVPLDDMVARLEKANALAYEQSARVEKVFKSEQDVARDRSDQQTPPPMPDRGSSRRRLALLTLVGLLLAALACVAVFGWSTYADAAKLIVARWANAELQRPTPPAAAAAPPELAQRLQTIVQDLASLEQRIEQLKSSQEQMVRDNIAVSQQLKAALAQTARDDAAVGEQLKASQQQLAVLQSFWASGLALKPWPIRRLVPQVGAQLQGAPRLKRQEKH